MPGIVSKINYRINDHIKKNSNLLILEAMKMENEVLSNIEGKIKEIFVKEQSSVQKNTLLMSITLE